MCQFCEDPRTVANIYRLERIAQSTGNCVINLMVMIIIISDDNDDDDVVIAIIATYVMTSSLSVYKF